MAFGIISATITNGGVSDGVTGADLNQAGLGYSVFDFLTLAGDGGIPAIIQVDNVDGLGAITDFHIAQVGIGYSLGTNVATTTEGAGLGATFDITLLGAGYQVGDEGFFTPLGGSGSDGQYVVTAVDENTLVTEIETSFGTDYEVGDLVQLNTTTGIGFGAVAQVDVFNGITTVVPDHGAQGATLNVTINASGGILPDATIDVSGGNDITINDYVSNSPTKIVINVTIAVDATLSARTVSVENPDDTEGQKTDAFTVIEASAASPNNFRTRNPRRFR